jgi:hypothetical protein
MTASRLGSIARPGSLLKRIQPELRRRRRQVPREHDGRHLALIRSCPCLGCDDDPSGEAAHVRMTRAGKPITGIGIKPDDRFVVPLCHACHMRQHRIGELRFWMALGLEPLDICARLYAVTGDIGAMRAIVFKERERRR